MTNIFKDKYGKTVIAQKPNLPIFIAAIAWTISKLANEGEFQQFTSLVSNTSLIYWSYLEIFSGVNKFRKILGFTVGCFCVYQLFGVLF